jgi:hypothetical protein
MSMADPAPAGSVQAKAVSPRRIACPSEFEIYAAETANWRVQKLLLHH